MKKFDTDHKILVVLFATLMFCLFAPQTILGQTEKLGIVQYTPVSGWTKTPKDNIVVFSQMNQSTGTFCIISLYGATPGTGDPQGDFTREWSNLVVKTFKLADKPTTETTNSEGWAIVAGGATVDGDLGKAAAFLTVISGFGQTVSVLAVFNNQEYVGQVDAFVKGIELDKPALPHNPAPAYQVTQDGKVIIPTPTRQLTVADLAGEWGEDAGRISTTYVDRSTGAHAGTDSLAFRTKMTFNGNGGYASNFFAIRNGKKEIDNTTGTVMINGRVLSIREKGIKKYVIRGWLALPEMTLLLVCGPWYDDGEIPERVFTDSEYGVNYNKTWIRKK